MMKQAETNLKDMLDKAYEEIRLLKEELQKYQKHNARGAGRKNRITEDDKQKIFEMRLTGVSYGKIAKTLNLPVSSIFNYSKLNLNSMLDTENGIESEDDDIISRFIYRDMMSAFRSKT